MYLSKEFLEELSKLDVYNTDKGIVSNFLVKKYINGTISSNSSKNFREFIP